MSADSIHLSLSNDNKQWHKKPIRRFFNIFFKYFLPDLIIIWKNRKNPFPIYVHTRILTPTNLGEHMFYAEYVKSFNESIQEEIALWENMRTKAKADLDGDDVMAMSEEDAEDNDATGVK